MATPRVDALVANVTGPIAALHQTVMETEEFVLEPRQLVELMQAAAQLNTLLYLEMGEPEAAPDEREGKLPSPVPPPSEKPAPTV